MKKVLVHIESDGSTQIDAQGFTGNSCTIATREIELALSAGEGPDSDKKKPDFYATTGATQTQRN